MQALKSRVDFFNSEEGQAVRRELQKMMTDRAYNTQAGYTADGALYPDNMMPFVDKHMNYLKAHPKMDIRMYLTNLQLMTRIRR